MYYAAINSYGSTTSRGFANTWNVLVFNTKRNRDNYVALKSETNITARAIKKSEITSLLNHWLDKYNRMAAPKPFSGEYWGILPDWEPNIPGFVGYVEVCLNGDSWPKLFK